LHAAGEQCWQPEPASDRRRPGRLTDSQRLRLCVIVCGDSQVQRRCAVQVSAEIASNSAAPESDSPTTKFCRSARHYCRSVVAGRKIPFSFLSLFRSLVHSFINSLKHDATAAVNTAADTTDDLLEWR